MLYISIIYCCIFLYILLYISIYILLYISIYVLLYSISVFHLYSIVLGDLCYVLRFVYSNSLLFFSVGLGVYMCI